MAGLAKDAAKQAAGIFDAKLDTPCSESDFGNSSSSDAHLKSIRPGEVCIVKRSDGRWRYGQLSKWDREYAVVVVTKEGADRTYGPENHADIRKLLGNDFR